MSVQSTRQILEERPELAQQAQEMVQQILARAATDWSFRQKLLHEPRAAVAEFTGREVPESFRVRFIESEPEVTTIVLPDPLFADAELSEAELEAVAGGATPAISAGIIAFEWALTLLVVTEHL